jgi:UDP-N-acetylglucosamine--N-acetylmuramyl-(pentapeptide) pyrophosphoryl-undecaprenol N-acetylglucosamine transferase
MRILFTGGGTAGHVNPALAIAAAMKDRHPDAEIAFVASDGIRDKANDLVPRAGYPLHTVHIRGMVRPIFMPANLKLPYYMIRAKKEAAQIVREFRPDLIVGTGGYACWPLCRVGIAQGIPTVIHESNAIPGKAIMKLAKGADRVLVNFEATADMMRKHTHPDQVVRVGNPMMPGFARYSRAAARSELGLSDNDLYILSFGGSLGAEYVNDAVVNLAVSLAADGSEHVKLLHAAGKRDYARIRDAWDAVPAEVQKSIQLTEYIYDMPRQMAAADLVISRAGAMSISELSLLGKAAIFIPSPYVAAQHQLKNAMALVREGAARCVEEHTLTTGALEREVRGLMADSEARDRMEVAIREKFAMPDANERICAILTGLYGS